MQLRAQIKPLAGRKEWAVRALLIVVLAAGLFKYIRSTIWLQIGKVPGDLAVFYVTGLAVRQGLDLYDPVAQRELAVRVIGPERAEQYQTLYDSNIHPPSEVWLPVLLSYLPWPAAADIWRWLLHFGFAASVLWVLFDLQRQGISVDRLLLATVLAVWLIPVQTSVDFGQIDVPLLLLLLLARDLYRRGLPVWSGIAIGVAACLKPSPVVLLIYFLIRRDWRVMGGAVGAAVVHILLSGILLGPQVWFDWSFNVLPHLLAGSTNYANQTFVGLSYHLFAPAASLGALDPPPSLPAARALANLLNVAFLGSAVFLAWKYSRRGTGPAFILGFSLFVVTMLVTSSISWEHYYTWTYIPIAALIATAAPFSGDRRDWIWIGVAVLAYGLIIATPPFHMLRDFDQYAVMPFMRLLVPLKVYGAVLLSGLLAQALTKTGGTMEGG